MQNKKLFKLSIWGAVFMILVGSLMHFVYAWSGDNVVIGLFVPISESVWEHGKMFIVPLIILFFFEWRVVKDVRKILWIKLVELLFELHFIYAFFFFYTAGLGFEHNLLIDVITFMVAIIVGKYISYRMLLSQRKTRIPIYISSILLLAIFGSFVVFTFVQPDVPLFEDPLEHEENHDH